MRLLLSDDEVTDEVPCIVGRYERAFFGAKASLACTFGREDGLLLFRSLIRITASRIAINEPECRRLLEVVATSLPIMVNHGRRHDEVLSQYKVVLTAIRILDNHTQATNLHDTEQLNEQRVEILAVL